MVYINIYFILSVTAKFLQPLALFNPFSGLPAY
jgi:hypothetical protein